MRHSKMTQTLLLVDTNFKISLLTIHNEIKQNMFVKNENLSYLSRDIEIIKKDKMEILELENTMSDTLKIHYMDLTAK